MRVEFDVPFVRGKGRARLVRATGRTYTPDATAMAMSMVRGAYMKASGGEGAPAGSPVSVSITTSRPMPRSRPKRVAEEPDTYRPDADNVAKLVLDALNGVAWADDTQVTELVVVKRPRDRTRAEATRVAVSWGDGEGESDDG